MTKEQIIDLLYNEIGNPDYKTVGDYHKGIADKLLTLIEQEKKDVAISIYKQLQGHGTTYVKNWIAKEYGVEL